MIPKVADVDLSRRKDGAQPYVFPTKCPECGSEAHREEGDSVRRCTGGLICPAQAVERLKHFVSRNAFDIEGLGAKQVEMFFNDPALPVKAPADIFTLGSRDAANPLQKLRNRDGFGEISATKLFAAIEARRTIPLDRLIFALGIRHVGEVAAGLLARHYGTWEAFEAAVTRASPGSELGGADLDRRGRRRDGAKPGRRVPERGRAGCGGCACCASDRFARAVARAGGHRLLRARSWSSPARWKK